MSTPNKVDQKILEELITIESDLSQRLKKLTADMSSSHSSDSSEQAVERENDEVIDQLESDARQELSQVKQAIERIKDGKYYTCSKCGSEISKERLKAIPYTTICIKCAVSFA